MFTGSAVTPAQRAYLDGVYDVDLGILRPAAVLPGGFGDFHDAAAIAASYETGVADAAKGWAAYTPPS
jgi:hypothetical protein